MEQGPTLAFELLPCMERGSEPLALGRTGEHAPAHREPANAHPRIDDGSGAIALSPKGSPAMALNFEQSNRPDPESGWGVLHVRELDQFPNPACGRPGILRLSQIGLVRDALKRRDIPDVALVVRTDVLIKNNQKVEVRGWHSNILTARADRPSQARQ